MNTPTNTASESILRDRVTSYIDRARNDSARTFDSIERDGNMLFDFILPLGAKGIVKESRIAFGHTVGGERSNLRMAVINGTTKEFDVHAHAVEQLGDKLKLAGQIGFGGYLRRLTETRDRWAVELAAKILNEHAAHSERQRVLVRAVGEQVRGILSDSYRRFSTPEVYGAAIKAAGKQGAIVVEAYYDEIKSHLSFLNPELFPVRINDRGDVTHYCFGLRVSTSDFGAGALNVSFYTLQAVCLNGAVRESEHRVVHLGGRLPSSELISERTFRLDSATQASAVSDLANRMLSSNSIREHVGLIQQAAATAIDVNGELKTLVKLGATKGEAEAVGAVISGNNPDDGMIGSNSLWKLSEAVGAVARNANAARKRELEALAGTLLSRVTK